MTSNNEFDVISSNTMVNAPNRAVFFLQTGKNGFCVTLDVPHTYILTVKNNGQNKVCLPFGPRWSLLQEEVFSERQPCDPGQTAQWNNGLRKSLCNASLLCWRSTLFASHFAFWVFFLSFFADGLWAYLASLRILFWSGDSLNITLRNCYGRQKVYGQWQLNGRFCDRACWNESFRIFKISRRQRKEHYWSFAYLSETGWSTTLTTIEGKFLEKPLKTVT